MSDVIRILQLSDTHFSQPGTEPEGGFAYDTALAFDAVFNAIADKAEEFDLVVVTGDVADHGEPEQYRRAAAAFERFQVPVNVCPGNHDSDLGFVLGLGRRTVNTSRLVQLANWSFLFVDSNSGIMIPDDTGRLVDPVGETRLHSNGRLGGRETRWIQQACTQAKSEHIFVWLHHPPSVPIPLFDNPDYAHEWDKLLASCPKIRGFGAGHTHIPDTYQVGGCPVFVAPALKHNFSLDPQQWLPPGYRSYEFHPDGSIRSEVHLVDGEAWPRRPFGNLLRSLFMGEITHDQVAAIGARKAGEAG